MPMPMVEIYPWIYQDLQLAHQLAHQRVYLAQSLVTALLHLPILTRFSLPIIQAPRDTCLVNCFDFAGCLSIACGPIDAPAALQTSKNFVRRYSNVYLFVQRHQIRRF